MGRWIFICLTRTQPRSHVKPVPCLQENVWILREAFVTEKNCVSGVLGDRVVSEEDAAADAGGGAADDQR